jgi:hypothetical protein
MIHGLTSLQSALSFHPEAKAHLICVEPIGDIPIAKIELSLGIKIYPLAQFPLSNKLFAEHLRGRSKFESLISIKPQLLLEFSQEMPEGETMIYQDTDVIYFATLNKFVNIDSEYSVFFFEHLYKSKKTSYPHGRYNAGFIIFKNETISHRLLIEWARKCYEWCFLKIDGNRYADQKYLEYFVENDNVCAERSYGINVGMHYFEGKAQPRKQKNQLYVNRDKLICFHFHGLKIHKRISESGLNRYGFNLRNLIILRILYLPALGRYFKVRRQLTEVIGRDMVNSMQLSSDAPDEYLESPISGKFKSRSTGTYFKTDTLARRLSTRKLQL